MRGSTALAAKESGLDQQFISQLNENSPDFLHTLYLSTTVVRQAIDAQAEIIQKIADQGSCVIIGRAADFVLREHENVIRIFLYAPKDYREEMIMKMYGDSKEQAKKSRRHSDEARAAYYNSISGQSWGSRGNYDLLLDTSAGVENCAEIICCYVENLQQSKVKSKCK